MEEIRAEDYMDMMRRIAWSFHRTTGLPFDDLFSNACVTFVRYKDRCDSKKGKASTLLWNAIKQDLICYCEEQQRKAFTVNGEDLEPLLPAPYGPEEDLSFKETLDSLSDEAKQVVEMIFASPQEFLEAGAKVTSVKNKLREQNWSWPKIGRTIREIKMTLNEAV